MSHRIGLALLLGLFALPALAQDPTWTPLWAGGKPIGWKQVGDGHFAVEDGALRRKHCPAANGSDFDGRHSHGHP